MRPDGKLEFSMLCEFRNPPGWARPFRERYYDAIDHIVWAEEIGYDCIYFTEHHFADDDYLTAPLMNAAIVADRTKRIRIGTCVLLLPLYNPVRLAEEGAFVDQLSEGRYELGFGTGYRPEEYAGFGVDWKTRGARTDEMVEIIRRLWTEDSVTFHGEHFQIDNVSLRPRPVQSPPPIWVGGFVKPVHRRAARSGDGLLIGVDVVNEFASYQAELQALGKDPATAKASGGHQWTYVSEDPERTWDIIAPYVMYHVDCYSKWGQSFYPRLETKEDLRATGLLRVLTPDAMIGEIRDLASRIKLARHQFFMNPGGIPLALMREPLELFANKVIPAFR
jgi:probable F420-dependent oxidoreductase